MDPNSSYQQPQYQAQPPQVNGQPGPAYDGAPSKSGGKKMLIIISLAVALILAIVLAVVMLGGSKDEPAPPAEDEGQSSKLLEPASKDSLQQIDSSLSQDITNIDDATDFPADQLSDDNLDL